ncbi:transmembrane amino acid transporter protein-domain-containing protein [Aspergillus karnatakaensis]|uniref:transmembrane amino acid transporter protein-domain-containing protein n=1 Tax=Aspergillus karnatakaensis TaxID=1810916 RepID=UPI003CCD7144
MPDDQLKFQRDDIEPGEVAADGLPQHGEILSEKQAEADHVFGGDGEEGPNYRSVGWIGTIILMMKTQIGLGVLSIPAIFESVGMIPGILLILAVSGVATWTSYMVGVFKFRHHQVYNIDDAGGLMFGRIGREVWAAAFLLFMIFVAGSAILGTSIGLNAVSTHGACTAVFVAVSAVIGFVFASIRTLNRIKWLAWVGLVAIVVSVFIVAVGVGIQDRPAAAPQDGPWASDYKLIGSPTFEQGVSAVSSLIFASSASSIYFSIAAEMREPRYFTRALLVAQAGSTMIYIAIGTVVYYYCGSYVASPALGSAGPLIKKVAYGIALPGLIATSTIFIHLSSKSIFVRVLRGSVHLTSNSLIHWASWISCTLGVTVVAYVIASGIPFFNDLVSLIGALLGAFLAYQPTGCMWFYDNWSKRHQAKTWAWMAMACWSVFIIITGCFITVAGTYASIRSVVQSIQADGGTKPWGCADNSNSV